METLSTIDEVRKHLRSIRSEGASIGLFPTMGALHEGHLQMVDRLNGQVDVTVVSLFVNPTQFAPSEDFERYPRDLEADQHKLEARGVDLLFAPSLEVMYPLQPDIGFSIGRLTDHLCGVSRPGHFQGVLQVVAKLFHIVGPDAALFSQKDLQQLVIIRRMVAELNFPLEVLAGPIIREDDGLALSSRNRYLSPDERAAAPVLQRSLQDARAAISGGERRASAVLSQIRNQIDSVTEAKLEYASAVAVDSLQPVERLEGRIALALAVHFGHTRLIDNLVLQVDGERVHEVLPFDP